MVRKNIQGLAIPTALFLVLVLFGLITAIQLQANQNLHLTRQGQARTRATLLAQAVVNLAIQRLNTDDTFYEAALDQELVLESSDVPLPNAAMPEGTVLSATLEEVEDKPDVYRVKGRATLPGVPTQEFTRVLVHRSTQGVIFAKRGGDHAASIFYRFSDGAWTPLPPVPNRFYTKDGSGNLVEVDKTKDGKASNDFVAQKRIRGMTADSKGNLYVIRKRDGPDTVLKLRALGDDEATWQDWQLLPPVPKVHYGQDGSLKVDNLDDQLDPDSDDEGLDMDAATRLRELASDGGDRLFAHYRRDGVDTVYMLDQSVPPEEQTWGILPPAPKAYYKKEQGNLVLKDTGELALDLRDFSADSKGHLYTRIKRDDGHGFDTILKFVHDPKAEAPENTYPGEWKALPEVPRGSYKKLGAEDELTYVPEPGKYANDLKGVAASPHGKVYVVYNPDGADVIFEFDDSGPLETDAVSKPEDIEQVAGGWHHKLPVTKKYLKNASTGQEVTKSDSVAGKFRNTSIDGDDLLYVSWKRDGVDSIFSHDTLVESDYLLLSPIPNVQWKKGGLYPGLETDPQPQKLDKTLGDPSGNDAVAKNIKEITGGGRPLPPPGGTFVPRASI